MKIPVFITRLLVAKKMYEPKAPKNDNIIKVEKPDILKKPKLTKEELEQDFKANRGTGAHNTSKKDEGKRKSNPKYQNWD